LPITQGCALAPAQPLSSKARPSPLQGSKCAIDKPQHAKEVGHRSPSSQKTKWKLCRTRFHVRVEQSEQSISRSPIDPIAAVHHFHIDHSCFVVLEIKHHQFAKFQLEKWIPRSKHAGDEKLDGKRF
jgi:hypothetical protein